MFLSVSGQCPQQYHNRQNYFNHDSSIEEEKGKYR